MVTLGGLAFGGVRGEPLGGGFPAGLAVAAGQVLGSDEDGGMQAAGFVIAHDACSPSKSKGPEAAAERERGGGERGGLLADQAAGLAGGLDGGLLDRSDRGVQLGGGVGGDGDQASEAEDPVTADQVGLLLEDVLELGGLLGVLDLADPSPLRGVGDVLGFAFADVAGGLVGPDRVVQQGDRTADPAREQQG